MEISRYLLDKYNSPVPRYTSYPPANHFTADFSSEDFRRSIIESNSKSPQNISIYIHIPFCKRLCHYCGCNRISMPGNEQVRDYISALKKELVTVIGLLDKSRSLSQIHFGGGTPNSIDAEYLLEINDLILNSFNVIENPEIAIECNPAYLDEKYISALAEARFNRFSLGIQDFNPDVLKIVNREEPGMPIAEICKIIKAKNKNSVINFDLIYGLPGQTPGSFKKTITTAASLSPDRIVTFSYAHLPSIFKAQKMLETGGLPSPDEKISMYLNTYNYLSGIGYQPIGLDHFVKSEDELYTALSDHNLHRNFQGYCTRRTTGQVYGFGVSSISQFENSFFQTTKSMEKYKNEINNSRFPVEKGYMLNESEMIVQEAIDELMCNKILDFNRLGKKLEIDVDAIKKTLDFKIESFNDFIDDGIIEFENDTIKITEIGVLFIRNVAAAIDPVFKNQIMNYSKSV